LSARAASSILPEKRGTGRPAGQDRDASERRHDLLEKLDVLAADTGGAEGKTGEVPSGPRQALREARLDGIVDDDHDDGDRCRRLADRLVLPQSRRDDHVDAQMRQLGRKAGRLLGVTRGKAAFDPDVLAVHPPERAQTVEEGQPLWRQRARGVRADREQPDVRSPRRGLRAHRAHRPAEQGEDRRDA
jgi:hypothetical protein